LETFESHYNSKGVLVKGKDNVFIAGELGVLRRHQMLLSRKGPQNEGENGLDFSQGMNLGPRPESIVFLKMGLNFHIWARSLRYPWSLTFNILCVLFFMKVCGEHT
jgi:hypothetical protein